MSNRLGALLCLVLTSCGTESTPASTPVSEAGHRTTGLDAAIVAKTIEAASKMARLRSLIVLRDGEPLLERRFNGGPPLDQPVNIKSASKSVLSALVGIAIERRVLQGVDQPVLSLLRAEAPEEPDSRLRRLTVGNLLSMQAGLERTSGENYGRWVSSPDWIRFVLSRPFVDEPGGRMLYSTGSSHLLSAMLTRASGQSTHELAQEWLAGPLGIAIPQWPRDRQGIYFGGNDMLMSPRAMSLFGEMYRRGGVLNGKRILPASWIEQSWTPRTVSPWSGAEYGYGWFIGVAGGHPVRFAWGYGGQMIYIVPDLDLTIVMTSDPGGARDDDHIARLHALLADGIIPAAVTGA